MGVKAGLVPHHWEYGLPADNLYPTHREFFMCTIICLVPRRHSLLVAIRYGGTSPGQSVIRSSHVPSST